MPFLNFGSNKNKYCKDDKANKKEPRKLKDPISSYPIAIKEVARLLQAMPPTQVSVERLFSALKLQKSDLRNRIKADALDALLLLKANSDHIDKVAYGERVRRATTSYPQLQSLQTPPLHNGKGASFNLSCF